MTCGDHLRDSQEVRTAKSGKKPRTRSTSLRRMAPFNSRGGGEAVTKFTLDLWLGAPYCAGSFALRRGDKRVRAPALARKILRRGFAVNTGSPEITIPSDILRKWQRIVDLLASIVQVPSAVVTKLEPPNCTYYRIVASSNSEGNPFPNEETFSMDIGTFCETVIKSREPLLVENALEDDKWKWAPEIQVGMVSYLGFPVLWPDGRMFGTICVLDDKANRYSDVYQELLTHCRDVLEGDLQTLARLGEELEEQRAHLSELFARVPEAVVMVDRDSRIMRVNPEFTKIFGYTAEEAIGQKIMDLITPDGFIEEVEGFMSRMVRAEDVSAVETVRRRKDGTRVPVLLTCVPVSSRGDGNAGYLIYRDIAEIKRLQNEQRRYHEIQLELANLNRAATLGQLSASIAHELNQPLTGIIVNSGACLRMLASVPPNLDGVHEAVRRTMRDGQRASEVITRLRALFGRKEPAFDPMDLNEATRDVIALSHSEFENSRVLVRTEFGDNLPLVMADRIQLQQVVLNLLRNALDAMSTVGEHPKDLLIKTERGEDDSVRLSVRDAGVGFDSQAVGKLFEAFYSTKSDGMGVGLAVSRYIIENHRGRIWATLNDGPGATFSFSVPCRARQSSDNSR
jgi:PAS domain S-box-containing protein